MSENAQAEPVAAPASAPPRLGFLDEAANIWRQLPHKFLFFALLAAWISLFHFYGNATMGYARTASLFSWARSVYLWRDDQIYAQYIPLIILLFLWMKRQELSAIAPRVSWTAVIYFAFAVLVHFVAFRVQQARLSIVAFIFGLHALVGVLWGGQAMRRTIFPFCLLFFCVPFGSWADVITFDLRVFVTKIAVGISHNLLGISVFRDGTQIFIPGGHAQYDVAPACSGINSLIAMCGLSIVYAFLNFDTAWRRGVLIVFALPIALAGNIIRLTTVIVVGEIWGQKAGLMIENKFGFVTFAIAIIGMLGLAWLLDERRKPAASADTKGLQEAAV